MSCTPFFAIAVTPRKMLTIFQTKSVWFGMLYVLNCLSKKYQQQFQQQRQQQQQQQQHYHSDLGHLKVFSRACAAVFPYTLHESVHDTNGQNCCGWMCKYRILCLWKWAWQCNLPLTPDLFGGSTETKPCQTNHVTCDAQVVYASNIFVLDQCKCDKKLKNDSG